MQIYLSLSFSATSFFKPLKLICGSIFATCSQMFLFIFYKAPADVLPAAGRAPAAKGGADHQGCTNTPTGAGAQQPEER